jgi:hypothetical protein
MRLVYNRFTVAVLVALAVVTLCATLIGLFAVSAQPARAGSCGRNPAWHFNCRQLCWDNGTCSGGVKKVTCAMDEVEYRTDPNTYRLVRFLNNQDYCSAVSRNCPTYCIP